MSYKKIIILPALFLLSNFLYLSCCKCIESKNHLYTINDFRAGAHGSGQSIIDAGMVTNVDTVYLDYSFYVDCVLQQKNPFAFLVNETMACKCNDCGSEGLKSKIISLDITSDSVYNGIPANTSLNNIFKVFTSFTTSIKLDSLKIAVNNNQYKLYSFSAFTSTKPANNKGHVFSLKIIFADGRQVMSSTRRIYWT
ncbi:MAG: hypothetical protein ABIW38_11785 [Ferruginibacter sp.]